VAALEPPSTRSGTAMAVQSSRPPLTAAGFALAVIAALVLLVPGGPPAAAGLPDSQPRFDMGEDTVHRGLSQPVHIQLWQPVHPDIRAVRVWVTSDSDPLGFVVTLRREARASAMYSGTFRFSSTVSAAGSASLRVADGDTFRIVDRTTSALVNALDYVGQWRAGAAAPDPRSIVFSDAAPAAAVVHGQPGQVEPGAQISVLDPGSAAVLATDTGRPDGSFRASFDNSSPNRDAIDLVIQESMGPASLPVRVVKAGVTGRVVLPDATPARSVWVADGWDSTHLRYFALTRGDGAFARPGDQVTVGRARLRADHQLPPGYGPSETADFTWDGSRTADVGVLTLTGAVVTGRVVDAGGRPVHEAQVDIVAASVGMEGDGRTGYSAYGDEDGSWGLWLPDGEYTFEARQPVGCERMQLVEPLQVSVTDGVASPAHITMTLAGGPATGVADIPRPAIPGTDIEAVLDTPAGEVRITFGDVVAGGEAYAGCYRSEQPPAVDVPHLPTTFELEVEGVAFSDAEVCVPYLDSEVVAANLEEADLRLFHVEQDGSAVDITTFRDVGGNVVCGVTTSFSPFLVGAPRGSGGEPPQDRGDEGELVVDRWYGAQRADTAASVSRNTFPPGVPVTFVATGADYPDALAAGPAAALAGAPVLLVDRAAVPAATAVELQRLQPRRIVILGGEDVVNSGVERALQQHAASGQVVRLAGRNRFETAAAVSKRYFPAGADVVYLVNGRGFADALSGGAAAAADAGPLLLVETEALPPATAVEIARLGPGRVVIVGGAAVVSEQVRLEAGRLGVSVERVAGSDRYDTAARVAERAFPSSGAPVVLVAKGTDFPDALAGIPAAAAQEGPLLLVRPDAVPEPIGLQLRRLSPARAVLLGGPSAISPAVEAQLPELVHSR
jgi:putative cell wall-binding protein